MYRLNKTLLYFLVLTIVASVLALKIIVRAYENAYEYNSYLIE